MVIVKLDTGFNIQVEFPIVPFYKRLFAWTIDLLACWLIVKLLATAFQVPSFFVWTEVWELSGLLVSLPVLFYHLVSEVTMNGRSLGKIAMNCKVITAEGGQPTLGQYLIRWVFRLIDFAYWIPLAIAQKMLPWWTMPLTFAGLISIVFTRRSQRLGDVVAGTILIDLKNSTSWEDTVFTEVSDTYQPKFPQVMQLSDRDMNTLKGIISTAKKNDDYELAWRIAERIKAKTNIKTDLQPLDFLEALLTDYNYYTRNS
jgi:uncharacterized RDD family membrane protein YckC